MVGELLERGHRPVVLAEVEAEAPERLAEVERLARVLGGGERVPAVREELAGGLPLVVELLRYILKLPFLYVDPTYLSFYLTNFCCLCRERRVPRVLGVLRFELLQ